jgi:uncharacterized repeat protein (TIGR01451 family)
VRQRRIAILIAALTSGLLGVYWVATGQEGRAPWPPPPVKFDPMATELHTVQQAGHQEAAPPIPPPIPATPTVPIMPNVPGGTSPTLPSPTLPPVAVAPGGAPAMPVADPPRSDPTRSMITDSVKQISDGKPPAFVLFPSHKEREKAKTPTAVTPQVDPQSPPVAAVQQPATPQPVMQQPALQQPVMQQTVARTVSPPDGLRLTDAQTPSVMVEKLSMAPRPGEPQAFQLLVHNRGSEPAAQIIVEDELPNDARLLQADPMPQVQGSRAVWVLTDVAAGSTRVLKLTLPGDSAKGPHSLRVHVSNAHRDRTSYFTAAGPPLPPSPITVLVGAPASATTGQPAVFEVTYANAGKTRVTALLLHALLSDGLRHPMGQSIEADVGDLEPGASKTVKVTVTAVLPGRQGIQVHLKSPSGAEATAHAAVEVAAAPSAGLSVQQAPATRVYIGRTTDLRIEVTNYSTEPMRQVNVVSYLPEGVDFIAASDYGNYQPTGRTVNWLLDPLGPGQTQAVVLRVTATAPGQQMHTVVARAVGAAEVKSTGTLVAEGTADLLVEPRIDNAVEVGRATVYELRVANPGSAPTTNVRVTLEFTPGLMPSKAEGPTAYRIDGQRVIFEGLSPIASQGQTLYRVLVVGQTLGDGRVRASVSSDQLAAPVMREAATRVYRD